VKDNAEAARWYRKSAEQGDAMAQNNLGGMYHNGNGVAQDYAEAVNWYHRAADQGLAEAQDNLGMMYAYGKGVWPAAGFTDTELRCFAGTGGFKWREGSSAASSSLRR
jgi:TPR repeat protein